MQGVSAGGPLGSHPHASSLMALTRDLSRLHFVVGTDTLVLILPLFTIFSVQSVQSLSHVQLCDPMDCSTSGFPVHHQLLDLAQIHVH